MIDVGGNNHAAAGHFVAHEFRRELFAVGYVSHLFRDHTLAGIMHLREITGGVRALALSQPIGTRLGDAIAVSIAVAGVAVHRGHVGASFPGGFYWPRL